ncbi:hypothetical protein [Bacillus altitudinis]|nr:hypothetical protein [Bacillus altitudinis]
MKFGVVRNEVIVDGEIDIERMVEGEEEVVRRGCFDVSCKQVGGCELEK